MGANLKISINPEWHEILKEFPTRVRLAVYGAVVEYCISGIVPELDDTEKMAFLFIKKEVDKKLRRKRLMAEKRRKAKAQALQQSDDKALEDMTVVETDSARAEPDLSSLSRQEGDGGAELPMSERELGNGTEDLPLEDLSEEEIKEVYWSSPLYRLLNALMWQVDAEIALEDARNASSSTPDGSNIEMSGAEVVNPLPLENEGNTV